MPRRVPNTRAFPFHHRPSTTLSLPFIPHARPDHFCSLDKTPRKRQGKISALTHPPLCSRTRVRAGTAPSSPFPSRPPLCPPRGFDGELSGLGGAAANGAKADTTRGEGRERGWSMNFDDEEGMRRGIDRSKGDGKFSPFLAEYYYFSVCHLFFFLDG